MSTIKFGTDGWRAIIAKEYTVDNVARVSIGTAKWLKANFEKPSVVIGYDCRFGGKMFAETAAKVFVNNGIKVYFGEGVSSTPMVSLGVVKQHASIGVVITASHNPADYNGYKLKGSYGGPLLPVHVSEVESMIPEDNELLVDQISLEKKADEGLFEMINMENMYIDLVKESFDLEAIANSNMEFAYDAMYGAGQSVMRKLLPEITFLHCDMNPSFDGTAPEPIHRNLKEFSEMIKLSENIDCGLATDGDADRIGLYNSKGEFVDSHHIILLLINYMVNHKKMTGKVVTAFSCTNKIKQLCEKFGLEEETVKIGFKHVCGIMLEEDCLLGGEESGGIAIKGHIPERDGIWMGLTIWEFMAKTGKSLEQLIDEVYELVGEFKFERIDLHVSDEQKHSIMDGCKSNKFEVFGDYKVERVEDTDGYKFFFNNDAQWMMIRPSGTEPVLRTYCEAETTDKAFEILKQVHKEILK
jgi:phosphomannomutase